MLRPSGLFFFSLLPELSPSLSSTAMASVTHRDSHAWVSSLDFSKRSQLGRLAAYSVFLLGCSIDTSNLNTPECICHFPLSPLLSTIFLCNCFNNNNNNKPTGIHLSLPPGPFDSTFWFPVNHFDAKIIPALTIGRFFKLPPVSF